MWLLVCMMVNIFLNTGMWTVVFIVHRRPGWNVSAHVETCCHNVLKKTHRWHRCIDWCFFDVWRFILVFLLVPRKCVDNDVASVLNQPWHVQTLSQVEYIHVQHQHVLGKLRRCSQPTHVFHCSNHNSLHWLLVRIPRSNVENKLSQHMSRIVAIKKIANIAPSCLVYSWTLTDGWCKNLCHGCLCWCPPGPNRSATYKSPVVTLWNGWKLGTCACQAELGQWPVAFSVVNVEHIEMNMDTGQNLVGWWFKIIWDDPNHKMYM